MTARGACPSGERPIDVVRPGGEREEHERPHPTMRQRRHERDGQAEAEEPEGIRDARYRLAPSVTRIERFLRSRRSST